jgi:AcrR family transcriptional regulator
MSEKIVALNVRDIAQRAGYSPATLYSYFKDLNDLTVQCVDSFLDDLEESIERSMGSSKADIPDLVKFYKGFSQYFIQYVGIYHLLFLDPQSLIRNHTSLGDRLFNLYKKFVDVSKYEENTLEMINFSVNGLLLFYLNRMNPKTYHKFSEDFHKIFENFGIKN